MAPTTEDPSEHHSLDHDMGTKIEYQLGDQFTQHKHRDRLRFGPCAEPPPPEREVQIANHVHKPGNPSRLPWLEDHMMLDKTPRGKVILVTGQGSAGLPYDTLMN